MVEENHNKFTRMITTYSIDYRTQLCEFFSRIIESHKAYISHGELQWESLSIVMSLLLITRKCG